MQRFTPIAVALALAFCLPTQADDTQALRDEINTLKQGYDRQLQVLEQRLAATENKAPAGGANAFNPAISAILTGTYANLSQDPQRYRLQGFLPAGDEAGPGSRGFSIGESELRFGANVDHLFQGALTLALTGENEVEVEEAKLETLGLGYGAGVTAGRFLSGIGYLNGLHSHTWDFVDLPLAYRAFYGGQYRNDGVQLRWLAPTGRMLELGLELGSGNAFPGGERNRNGAGAVAGFVRIGDDIGGDFGWQANGWYQRVTVPQRAFDSANAAGADVANAFSGRSATWGLAAIAKYNPAGNIRRQLKFSGEYLQRREAGELSYDTAGAALQDSLHSRQSGWYLQAGYRFLDNWRASLRYDRLDSGRLRVGLVENGIIGADDLPLYAAYKPRRSGAALDFLPSEFSHIRLQFNRDHSQPGSADNQVFLQYTLSLGAHAAHSF